MFLTLDEVKFILWYLFYIKDVIFFILSAPIIIELKRVIGR